MLDKPNQPIPPSRFIGEPNRNDHTTFQPRAASGPLSEAIEQGGRQSLPGDDREWVPKVELPAGGGAIKSTGEKAEAIAFTGASSYSIAIPVSPARAGGSPQLNLSYSSGAGNGIFGVGWSLSVPSISRRVEHELPEYADGRESDTFLLFGAEYLVPLLSDDGERVVNEREDHFVYPYRPRVEGLFARIERWVRKSDGDTSWRVISKDNITSFYGRSEQARIADPQDTTRIFSWLLEETRDDRGNVTVYLYKPEEDHASSGVAEINRLPTTNRYLKRILYGNRQPNFADDWMFEVVFDYGEHGALDPLTGRISISTGEDRSWPIRNDAFSSFRSGFDVRTRRRCHRILMFHRFPELSEDSQSGATPTLVKSTDFEYDSASHLAKLMRVTQRSYQRHQDGSYEIAEYPATEMTYSEARVQNELRSLPRENIQNLPFGVDGISFRFADLNGEGLPGIVMQDGETMYYKRPFGNARFGQLVAVSSQTSTARMGRDGRLIDVDGDGRLELVALGSGHAGYYDRTEENQWENFSSFKTLPAVDFDDNHLRQIDLNGDGLPDLLISQGDSFVWYPSSGIDGYEGARLIRKPADERAGPRVLFDDPTGKLLFADMSGDGLQDVVRIENGSVYYWPNLGLGRFGRRVTMADAPNFGAAEEFDARRIRLVDIDGSGTADIIYLDPNAARVWLNQSGNGFSSETVLHLFPGVDAVTAVETTDLLGKGTACLVWSQAADWAKPDHLQYLDLMGDKPHLLTSVRNNMGLETRLEYEPSTTQYLRDQEAGMTWITRLPFPVYVATRIEHYDEVARRRFVQRFAYHHGFYDGVEREFRGFAMVERWDSESFEDFNQDGLFSLDLFDTIDEQLHQPPLLTRTWFHTGAYIGHRRITRQLANEYWNDDPQAWQLTDTVLPAGLTAEETLEASRALRGNVLRQELFALDGGELEGVPYTVAEKNFAVQLVQPKGDQLHAVFFVHDRESFSFSYDRNANDPRISHEMVLEVDKYGNVTRSVSIGYPRRIAELPEQEQHCIIASEHSFGAIDDLQAHPDQYRWGLPVDSRSFEVHGLPADGPLSFETLRVAVADAIELMPDETPVDGVVQKRLLGASRFFYYDDDLSGTLPAGQCGTRGLLFETQAAVFSGGQVEEVYDDDVNPILLQGEAAYLLDDDLWWARSSRQEFDADRFFLPIRVFDPLGNPPTLIEYDSHSLFANQITDAVENIVSAEYDYRVLSPQRLTNANADRIQAEFDIRGYVISTAVMGRAGAGDGDTPDDPTSRFEYDIFAWQDRQEPNFAHSLIRETHADPNTRWLETFIYSDGSGNAILEKVSAEPGLASQRDGNGDLVLDLDGTPVEGLADPRWLGTGRTVFDNRGNVVKQYEPYFSSTHEYEDEIELREHGVTPLMHYDPLGRLIRTDLPNGTFSSMEFNPWMQRAFDSNDNVLQSDWHNERIFLPAGSPEHIAAEMTELHADTPTITHLDHLGRAVLVDQHNRSPSEGDAHYLTRVHLDIQGNVLRVVDARDNTAEQRYFGMLGQLLRTTSVDAGQRRTLKDAAGNVIRGWDSRGHEFRMLFDQLQRPTHRFVRRNGSPEVLVERNVYGESHDEVHERRLRGQLYLHCDQSGVVASERFDFKGNLLESRRQLARQYRQSVDWFPLSALTEIDEIETTAADQLEAEVFTSQVIYDALNRPVTVTTPDNSLSIPAYNLAGLLETLDVHIRGADTATRFVSNVNYDARRRRAEIEYGNGVRTRYEYDEETFRLNRLTSTRLAQPQLLQDLIYTYDPVGNIIQIRDMAGQEIIANNELVSPETNYRYDALYQLIEAHGREQIGQNSDQQRDHQQLSIMNLPHANDSQAMRRYTQQYEYDEVGNILRMIHLATGANWNRRYQYADDGNRLLATSRPGDDPLGPFSDSYQYDAHGNMTVMPHLPDMQWDFDDQLQATARQIVNDGTPETTYYVYDATGQRVRKVTESSAGPGQSPVRTSERIYLGANEIYREYENDGQTISLERETLHVSDDQQRIALVETRTQGDDGSAAQLIRFQLGNHLGSVALELDNQAALISYEEFHPFGTSAYRASRNVSEVNLKRYRYTGKERDEETGLYYHGARYYACWLGRWTAADPIGLRAGPNRYSYAANDPVRLSDPTGLAPYSGEEDRTVPEGAFMMNPDGTISEGVAPVMEDVPATTDESDESFVATEIKKKKMYFGGGGRVATHTPTDGVAFEPHPDLQGAMEGLGVLIVSVKDSFTPRLESREGDPKMGNIFGVIEEGIDLVEATDEAAQNWADAQADVEIARATGDKQAEDRARKARGRAAVLTTTGVVSIATAGRGLMKGKGLLGAGKPPGLSTAKQSVSVGGSKSKSKGSTPKRKAPAPDNYRGRYNADRHAKGLPRLPDEYDAHHAIPQRYMDHPEFKDFDFHDPSNLRGVKGSRADVNIHQEITNLWEEFAAKHPNPTRSKIEAFRDRIDKKFRNHWF